MKHFRIYQLGISFVCLFMCVSNEPFPTATASQLKNLYLTLQQNPSLVQQLRANPQLVKTLQESLLKQQSRDVPLVPLRPQEPLDQCSSLRIQNARLKQMIQAVIDGSGTDLSHHSQPNSFGGGKFLNLERRQRELGAPHFLLNQPPVLDITKTSLQSVKVTPTPSWTTSHLTSSYVTLITQPVSKVVPIIVRGNKIVTTIEEKKCIRSYCN